MLNVGLSEEKENIKQSYPMITTMLNTFMYYIYILHINFKIFCIYIYVKLCKEKYDLLN